MVHGHRVRHDPTTDQQQPDFLTQGFCFTAAPYANPSVSSSSLGTRDETVSLPHPAMSLRRAECVFLGVIGWEGNQEARGAGSIPHLDLD